MIENIVHNNKLIAIIISGKYRADGVVFFTPGDLSQQLAYIHHPDGKVIYPHIHNMVKREVQKTQEVLIIKRGKIRVDLYDDDGEYINSRNLVEGDVLLLASGGHGFEVMEEVEMIEVKQGPYAGDTDKKGINKIDYPHIINGKNNG